MDFDISLATWEMVGRYFGAGFALGLGGIGAAIGMGLSAGRANEGIMRQPECQGQMMRTMLIGQAVGSSPSVFALIIGLMILFLPGAEEDVLGATRVFALMGAGLAIGLGALGSGWGCGFPGGEACNGIARNPRQGTPIMQSMIIGQAVAQSPSIFALVIAFILLLRQEAGSHWGAMGVMIGAGLAIGASALGSGIGSGRTAGGGVQGVSHWPKSHGITIRTMLIGQAVCETPAIFGLLVAFIMLVAPPDLDNSIVAFAMTLGAGIAVGFGGIGPGIGSGLAGGSGCAMTARYPRLDALLMRTMLIGQAVSQSTAIYALIIALALLYVV